MDQGMDVLVQSGLPSRPTAVLSLRDYSISQNIELNSHIDRLDLMDSDMPTVEPHGKSSDVHRRQGSSRPPLA